MAGTDDVNETVQLIGRDRERAELERLIDRVANGESTALVLRGEAGIGKTALLEHVAERAGAMTVLRATGVEAESDLAFAGLYGLLRPVTEHLAELPETQSAALAGALGLAPSAGSDRLLLSAAVLGLLAAAAEQHPVLCLVDDAQWLDTPSAEALVFVARRLRAERVALLFAAREGDVRSFPAPGIADLVLEALDAENAQTLLARRTMTAAAGVRERLIEQAAGNPLALLELPTALSADQLAGRLALPDSIPLTHRLQDAFLRRFELLPAETRAMLLIAAADDTGDVTTVMLAAEENGLPRDALDPAEGADLVRVSGTRLEFRHPLVRSAVYEGATLSQRQKAHAALASALPGEEHADRRVWHQAMATLTADEAVAAALEASARRSQLRGGHASAATAYQRSAALSGEEGSRTPRLAAAAQAAWDAGQPDRARELIARSLPLATDELRVRLLYLRGVIEARAGNLREAIGPLLSSAEASTEPSLTLEILLEAAETASFAGELSKVTELGEWAARIPAENDRDRFIVSVLNGFAKEYSGHHTEAQALFAEALSRAGALHDPRALIWAANAAAVSSGDLGQGLEYVSRAIEIARERGLLSLLPLALEQQAMNLISQTSLDIAYAVAEEGYRLSLEVGHGSGWHLTNMATIEAAWGREEDARRHAEEVIAISERRGDAFLLGISQWTLGFLDLTMGRPNAATDRLLAFCGPAGDGHPIAKLSSVPNLVEAAVRAGRADEVQEMMAIYRAMISQAPTDARCAMLAFCDALLGARAPDEAFREAIERGSSLSPFQRARTVLHYGEWQRRERRRQEARVHLREALEIFRRIGARPWEERAAGELRATGESTRRRDPSTLDDLTPQELQIATLVAAGMTNREIAAQLFLSPRTIDYHLRKVFSKMGIVSRAQLAGLGLPQRERT